MELLSKVFKAPVFENLVELDFSSNALTDKRASRLYEALSQCKTLSKLDFSDNKLVSCEGLASIFKHGGKFDRLSFKGNKIGDAGLDSALHFFKVDPLSPGLTPPLYFLPLQHSACQYVNLTSRSLSWISAQMISHEAE